MPKLKTHKSLRKRFRVTAKRRLIRRSSGQDHFNAREPGKVTTRKRRDRELAKSLQRPVRRALPYV